MKIILFLFFMLTAVLMIPKYTSAQDPNFSQFFTCPLNINPAIAGDGDNRWRVMSTFRSQSLSTGANYRTKAISADGRIYNNTETLTYVGLGAMLMTEDAMDGVFKSNYFSLNTSCHIALNDNDWVHGLTLGLGWIYNKINIDYAELTTGQQLSSMGFNRQLPTGEPSLNNIPGISSVSAGLIYTFSSDNLVADFGVAGFRFFKTKQSVFDNTAQFSTPRYDAHFSIGKILNDRLNINMNGYYQTQNGVQGFSFGGHLGFSHSTDENAPRVFNLGAYYRVGDALIPYVGYVFNDFQVGLTYDVQVSPVKSGAVSPNSFEISLIYRNYKSSRNPLLW